MADSNGNAEGFKNELFSHPMHLFKPSEDHTTLVLVPETVKLLSQLKGPVVIVTIVGTQRGGKSTLLNLLHSRKTAGFGLGHYMDAQTTGLWIWTRPHPRDQDVTLILMDTQGLDTPHIPQSYNWMLSALALLISSFFIYQTKVSIDSNAVDRLGVILKVAEQLRGASDSDPSTTKPSFLWLIRDQQLQMKKQPRQEMWEKLDQGAKNALQKCFQDYDCFPLPKPVDKDELLKEVDNMGWDQLRSEFREEYVVLERQIFAAVQNPRMLSGVPITGEIIASLIDKYSHSIANSGIINELSQLPTQRQMVVKMAGERAIKDGGLYYKNAMQDVSKKFPLPETELAQIHHKAYTESLRVFKQKSMMDENADHIDPELQEFVDEFNKQIASGSRSPPLSLVTAWS